MPKRPWLMILILAASALPTRAQEEKGAKARAPESLDAILKPIREKHHLPALAGAIVTSEGLEAIGAVGVRKQGDGTPVTVDDQFHIGSNTKSMTATLLAMLVEEGKLSWKTTLAEALPELKSSMKPAYRNVTIEQLMAHKAGLSGESWPKGMNFLQLHKLPGTPREQRWAYAKRILAEPPASKPGTKFEYANRGYAIGGVIAERLTKTDWEDLLTARLFKPLGMTSAGFGSMGHPGKVDQPWQHRFSGGKAEPVEPGPLSDNPAVIGPGGTVHLSMSDWGKYISAHLQGEKGKPGLLKPETFRHLHTPPPGGDYGYGWSVTERSWGGRVLTHSGSNTMNFAVVWMSPSRDFAVLAATNQAGGGADQACDEVAAALIGHHLEKK